MATFTNQASLTYNGITTNSNIIVGELQEVLSAAKNATLDTYAPGEEATYVISIVNAGTTPFTNLTVTDNLGTYPLGTMQLTPLTYVAGSMLLYLNGVLQAAPAVTAGPPMVVTGLNIPAGANAVLVYKARVNQFASPEADATIVNTAVISGAGLTSSLTATETITASGTPRLSITKSLSPTTVAENGQLTYTFVIQNAGSTPVTAADNVVLTDLFDPILNPIAVSFGGVAWAEGTNYTYQAATGEFATIAGQITVPAATYTRDAATGAWVVTPGTATLVVTGTV